MISLTTEQRESVLCDENVLISACPGSGKTRVIVAKLLRLTDGLENSPRSVACITYTNAAVDEISSRVKKLGSNAMLEACEVATIHSFCLRYILRPYSWLVPDVPSQFTILTRDSDKFEDLVRAVEAEVGRPVQYRAFEDYASLRMTTEGDPRGPGITGGVVSDCTARRFWELMRLQGYIDYALILYYSFLILRDHEFVSQGLSSKFSWMLVDEFQDTTDIQTEILSLLHRQLNSQFFLVGDENQSISAFAGARPDLARKFAERVDARLGMAINGNFRCGQHIVDAAEQLIPRVPSMYSAGEAVNRDGKIFAVSSDTSVAIEQQFIRLIEKDEIQFGDTAILAPWWRHLLPVAKALRKKGIPVVGPGARPYRRNRLFSALAEQLGACVDEDSLDYVVSVERAIYGLINNAMGVDRLDVFSYRGRCTALKLVYAASKIANSGVPAKDWLVECADACAELLVDDEWIDQRIAELLSASAVEMLNDISKEKINVDDLKLEDLGIFANPSRAIKLLTLHNSKGREFEAVAIINANEGKIPNFKATTQSEIDEAKRLFYVGITRSKRHVLVVSDSSDRDGRSRFIQMAGI